MNILFINPPARDKEFEPIVVPPLGLLYVAAAARKAGHEARVLDAFGEGMDWQQFAGYFVGKKFDVIAVTAMTPTFDTAARAVAVARNSARFVVIGGPHATANADSILADNPSIDFAVIGEGEETFPALLDCLAGNGDPATVAGVATRNGALRKRPMLADLDALPFPLYDGLPMANYRYPFFPGRRVTSLITSRGCPFNCIFCDKGVFGSRWTARSADNVLAEIDWLVRDLGVQSIVFYDDLFTADKKRMAAICQGLIDRDYDLTWKAEGRVDLADGDSLALMRRAGCTMLAYGVESANPHGLAFLRKKTTPAMSRKAFALTRQAGIRTMAYFILGIPVETYGDALRSIRFAGEIGADYAQFSILSPIPGSDLFALAEEKGWIRRADAGNVQDKDGMRAVMVNENWDEQSLKAIVRRAHRDFYLRPSYMLRTLLREARSKGMANLFKTGYKVLRYSLGLDK